MKRYTQLDKYARLVFEDEGRFTTAYLEWNSLPNLDPRDFKYDVELTKDVLGEAMVVIDIDDDATKYACEEQCFAYWEATK